MGAVLEVSGLTRTFGGLMALDNVSFSLYQGEVVGLIGPNGAGKSTLINCITGMSGPYRGQVRLDGRLISGRRASEICRAGIGRTFQIPRPFPSMTVWENVLAVARDPRGQAVAQCLAVTGLSQKAGVQARHLTFHERRKLELARALATAPKILLLDEIAAGLNQVETQEMVATIRRVRETYRPTILWVEHIMEAILENADRVLVLDRGRLIATGSPREIASDPKVIEAYLGQEYVFRSERVAKG